MAAPPILDQWSTAPEYDPCHKGRISRIQIKGRSLRCNFFGHFIRSRMTKQDFIRTTFFKNWYFLHSAWSENMQSFYVRCLQKKLYFVPIKVISNCCKLLASCPVNFWQNKKKLEITIVLHRRCCPLNGFKSNNMLRLVYMILKL